MDEVGNLTAAGEYYYEKTALAPPTPGPGAFDPRQEPTRRGNRYYAKLLDGTKAVLRTFDPVTKQWKHSKLGTKFYAKSLDRYTVTFPTIESRLRVNGTTFTEKTVLKSTAVALGEIQLSRLLSDEEQLTEVKRRTAAFIASLPENEHGMKVLIEGGGSMPDIVLDESRGLEYNKEEFLKREDGSLVVTALLHRLLRDGKPWDFGFPGVCKEAYDETEGRCIQHQLGALLEKDEAADLESHFDDIFESLYANNEDNPYIDERGWREVGVTATMVIELAKIIDRPVHVLWGRHTKVLSYTPEKARGKSLCLVVWGTHGFFVNDPQTKSVVTRMEKKTPKCRSEVVLKVILKSDTPPSSEWKAWLGDSGESGHYYVGDLAATRPCTEEACVQKCSFRVRAKDSAI